MSVKYLLVFGERNPSLMLSVKSNTLITDLLHDFANVWGFFFPSCITKDIGSTHSKLRSAFLLETFTFCLQNL